MIARDDEFIVHGSFQVNDRKTSRVHRAVDNYFKLKPALVMEPESFKEETPQTPEQAPIVLSNNDRETPIPQPTPTGPEPEAAELLESAPLEPSELSVHAVPSSAAKASQPTSMLIKPENLETASDSSSDAEPRPEVLVYLEAARNHILTTANKPKKLHVASGAQRPALLEIERPTIFLEHTATNATNMQHIQAPSNPAVLPESAIQDIASRLFNMISMRASAPAVPAQTSSPPPSAVESPTTSVEATAGAPSDAPEPPSAEPPGLELVSAPGRGASDTNKSAKKKKTSFDQAQQNASDANAVIAATNNELSILDLAQRGPAKAVNGAMLHKHQCAFCHNWYRHSHKVSAASHAQAIGQCPWPACLNRTEANCAGAERLEIAIVPQSYAEFKAVRELDALESPEDHSSISVSSKINVPTHRGYKPTIRELSPREYGLRFNARAPPPPKTPTRVFAPGMPIDGAPEGVAGDIFQRVLEFCEPEDIKRLLNQQYKYVLPQKYVKVVPELVRGSPMFLNHAERRAFRSKLYDVWTAICRMDLVEIMLREHNNALRRGEDNVAPQDAVAGVDGDHHADFQFDIFRKNPTLANISRTFIPQTSTPDEDGFHYESAISMTELTENRVHGGFGIMPELDPSSEHFCGLKSGPERYNQSPDFYFSRHHPSFLKHAFGDGDINKAVHMLVQDAGLRYDLKRHAHQMDGFGPMFQIYRDALGLTKKSETQMGEPLASVAPHFMSRDGTEQTTPFDTIHKIGQVQATPSAPPKPSRPLSQGMHEAYETSTQKRMAEFYSPPTGAAGARESILAQAAAIRPGSFRGCLKDKPDKAINNVAHVAARAKISSSYLIEDPLPGVNRTTTFIHKFLESVDEDTISGYSKRYVNSPLKRAWKRSDENKALLGYLVNCRLLLAAAYSDVIGWMSPEELVWAGLREPVDLFTKQEAHSSRKKESRQWRLIWPVGMVDACVEFLLTKAHSMAQITAYQEGKATTSTIGMGHHDPGHAMTIQHLLSMTGGDPSVPLTSSDAKSFDLTVPRHAIMASGLAVLATDKVSTKIFDRDYLRRVDHSEESAAYHVDNHPDIAKYRVLRTIMRAHFCSMSAHVLVIGGELFRFNAFGGHASGRPFTSSGGTFHRNVTTAIANDFSTMIFRFANFMKAAGDDESLGFRPSPDAMEDLRSMGILIKEGSLIHQSLLDGVTFTSHLYQLKDPSADPLVQLNATVTFLNLEKSLANLDFHTPDKKECPTDRLAGILYAVRSSPEQRRIVYDVMDHFGWSLDPVEVAESLAARKVTEVGIADAPAVGSGLIGPRPVPLPALVLGRLVAEEESDERVLAHSLGWGEQP